MKRLPLLSLLATAIIIAVPSFGQTFPLEAIALEAVPPGTREIVPTRARYYRADTLLLRQSLFSAPAESSAPLSASATLLQIPAPDGSVVTFQLVRYPMLEAGLAEKFPGIVNLYGRETGKGQRRIRLDWTYRGFHAVVRGDPSGDWYIDPLHTGDRLHYQVYRRTALPAPSERPQCGITETVPELPTSTAGQKYGNCSFRVYQLAVATTGEYYANEGNTDTDVLSTINTTVSRVNEVTEIDLAIRFVLVANNDLLLFPNGNTDPYDDTDASQILNANTGVINGVIGSANYDIGHVFNWNGSGRAQLNSVCNNTSKGRGTTQRSALPNDIFYIDYVAHELAHQMGAPHTFNAVGNGNCTAGSRSAANAFEPGSGSTIMAYAGICSGANVQSDSDAYFHVSSLTNIANFMELGGGAGCATVLATPTNTEPVVSAGTDHTIPANTPFVLTATGSDADGDPLTYTWEQYDAMATGYSGPPAGSETAGPLFRSLPPASNPSRYFPNLSDLVAGASPDWEVLPTVARALNFRVTARDGAAGFGCTAFDETELTVVNSTGFAVTQPAGGESWSIGTTQTVTWDVAGTGTGTAVNCAQVDILLSTDGGASFGILLAENVVNDGSHPVTIPAMVGTTNRIQVRSADNVFFNVSPQNFTIAAQTFVLNTADPTLTFCAGDPILLPLTVQSLDSYAGTVSLSVSNGLPGGAAASFTTNPVSVGVGATVATTLELTDLTAGDYTIEVTGTDGFAQRVLSFDITVKQGVRAVTLSMPENGTVLSPTEANFSWTADEEATSYAWFLYESIGQSSLIGFAVNNPTISPNLSSVNDGNYFWRVGVQDSECDSQYGNFSSYRAVTFSRTQLSSPDFVQTTCTGNATAPDYTIDLASGSTLTGTVSFATADLPSGVNASFAPATLNGSGATQLALSGLAGLAAGDYPFRVIASDAGDSETLGLLLTVLPPVAAVTLTAPDDGSFQTGRQVSMQWTADPTATVYDLAISVNSGMSSPLYTATLNSFTTGITLNFEGFSDGTTVYWQVTSEGDCGSPVASPVFSYTFGAAPLPVTWLAFSASAISGGAVLDWRVDEVADNAGFYVTRSEDGRYFRELDWVPAQQREGVTAYRYHDRSIQDGATYYYRLHQIDYDGEESFSPVRQLRITPARAGVRLQPNPATNAVMLLRTGTTSGNYELVDALGRTVRRGQVTAESHTIDLRGLAAGLYFVHYRQGNERVTLRLVKQ